MAIFLRLAIILYTTVIDHIEFNRIRAPSERSVAAMFSFIGKTLGFKPLTLRLLIYLYKATRYGKGALIEEIEKTFKINRKTTTKIVNKLIRTGFAKRDRNKVLLRTERLTNIMYDLAEEVSSAIRSISKFAQEIDRTATKNKLEAMFK